MWSFVVLKLIVYSPELLELPESPFLCRISFIFQTRALINTAVFFKGETVLCMQEGCK